MLIKSILNHTKIRLCSGGCLHAFSHPPRRFRSLSFGFLILSFLYWRILGNQCSSRWQCRSNVWCENWGSICSPPQLSAKSQFSCHLRVGHRHPWHSREWAQSQSGKSSDSNNGKCRLCFPIEVPRLGGHGRWNLWHLLGSGSYL
jgi:hypothetical protein